LCNLYSLNKKRDMVARFFRVSHNRAFSFEPSSGFFQRHVAPVVRSAPDGERELVTMSWGFFRLEKGRAPKPVTNVRDGQIRTNPFWRDSFKQRRCLVPAGAFCEPNGDVRPATWHWFAIYAAMTTDRCLRSPASGDATLPYSAQTGWSLLCRKMKVAISRGPRSGRGPPTNRRSVFTDG
jgi:hypothetical protein